MFVFIEDVKNTFFERDIAEIPHSNSEKKKKKSMGHPCEILRVYEVVLFLKTLEKNSWWSVAFDSSSETGHNIGFLRLVLIDQLINQLIDTVGKDVIQNQGDVFNLSAFLGNLHQLVAISSPLCEFFPFLLLYF